MANKQIIVISIYHNVIVRINDILTPDMAEALAYKLLDVAKAARNKDRETRRKYVAERQGKRYDTANEPMPTDDPAKYRRD